MLFPEFRKNLFPGDTIGIIEKQIVVSEPDRLEAAMEEGGARIYTLGTLIHNETYNRRLREAGVGVTSVEDLPELLRRAKGEPFDVTSPTATAKVVVSDDNDWYYFKP